MAQAWMNLAEKAGRNRTTDVPHADPGSRWQRHRHHHSRTAVSHRARPKAVVGRTSLPCYSVTGEIIGLTSAESTLSGRGAERFRLRLPTLAMITMSAGVGLQGTNSGLPHTAHRRRAPVCRDGRRGPKPSTEPRQHPPTRCDYRPGTAVRLKN